MKALKPSKKIKFKYSLIALAVLETAFASSLARAQEEPVEEEAEVIEVTGLRGEWQNAQSLKQNSDTVMDAITATDISVLPDRSVLEAISRLPGVAMGRFAGSNDPDHFGTEGSGVVVRGLTHVRSEFNGRDTFTADAGRALSFQDVPPELMGSVEVYKNQTADMVVGGISGTVNLNTKKPFDSDKRLLAFSLEATYSDYIEDTTPTFSGLYSDVFDTDLGKFGLLVNYSKSKLKAQSDGIGIGKYAEQDLYQVNGETIQAPKFGRFTRKQDDRDREGAAVVVQWENPDNTIVATGEYIRSDSELEWSERVIEGVDGNVASSTIVPVGDTEFEVDGNGFFQSGIMTDNNQWRGNCAERCDSGFKHTANTRTRFTDNLVEDFSFNIKYTPNDTWAFNYDLQYIDSKSDVVDMAVMLGTFATVGIDLSGSGMPRMDFYHPDYAGGSDLASGTGHFTDPANSYWRSAMEHLSDNEGDEWATRFDVNYTFDEGFFTDIKVGARYAKRQQTTRQSTYNWGGLTPEWRGADDIAWLDTAAGQTVPYEVVSFNDFGRRGAMSADGGTSFLFPALSLTKNYRGVEEQFAALNPDWRPINQREGATGDFIDNEINDTEEVNKAFYVRADFEGYLGGFDYRGNVGLRYVRLENDTAGFLTFPDETPTGPEDGKNLLPDDQKAFGNGYSESTVASSTYDKVLPSFNLTVDVTDEVLARVGISKALALPSLGYLRNYISITGTDTEQTYDPETGELIEYRHTRYTASSGNPDIQPMESTNLDLTLEWYFSEVGSLTGAVFYKDLKNYFVNGVREQEFTNNGVTQVVEVSGAVNGGEGSIKGAEVAFQTFFDFLPAPWDGLGFKANYAYIEDDGSPNSGLSADHPDSGDAGDIAFDNLPLEGLSKDNLNLEGLYEKGPWQARLAYNWRSEYLLTTRDVITQLPIFQEDNGYLDASLFYELEDYGLTIGAQVQNVTDSVAETSMQIDNEGTRKSRAWFMNDRRYSLIVRGSF
ncbi:TonB-dependent receptor [Neiella marina]|uniref:TonB-dependent receptor n=1 Tax=Neiella marina TaxID=508461 RepID=A0A8J2U2N4_9GAMM|nr:TonB-dependent receptor [Neiella marina]GGA66849.1 TonB-dependent receptor [Neiella marina]